VRVGDREFDWQPSVYAGRDYVPTSRGGDTRLEEQIERASAAQRLAERKARRVRAEEEAALSSKVDTPQSGQDAAGQ
jgi:GTP-binding protein